MGHPVHTLANAKKISEIHEVPLLRGTEAHERRSDLMDSPTFYARRGSTELSEYIGGLVARKETYKFQDAMQTDRATLFSFSCTHLW